MRVPRGSNRREPGKVARSLIHLQHLYLSLLLLDTVVSEDLSHSACSMFPLAADT